MEIAWGKGNVILRDDIIGKVTVIAPRKESVICDVSEHVETICKKLAQKIASGNIQKVAIITEDRTRENPEYPLLLNKMIDVLESQSVKKVFLVPAYGTHPAHSLHDHKKLYSEEVLKRVTLVEHDCHNQTHLSPAGVLLSGQVLRINSTVASADFIIALGSVAPHAFAGFTGGPKIILPGIADYETIRANHSQIRSYGADLCCQIDNPVHEQMMEALRFVKIDYAIQTVRSAEGTLAGIFYGDLLCSYDNAIDCIIKCNGITVGKCADLVIASCGGAPCDDSLYSGQRCISVASKLVNPGGMMVIIGEFSNLIGNQCLADCLINREDVLNNIRPEQIEIGMHSALLMIRNMAGAKVSFLTSWEEAIGTKYNLDLISSMGHLEDLILKKTDTGADVFLVPDSSNLVINPKTREKQVYA